MSSEEEKLPPMDLLQNLNFTEAAYIQTPDGWRIEAGRLLFPDGSMHVTKEWIENHEAKIKAKALDDAADGAQFVLDNQTNAAAVCRWLKDRSKHITRNLT